MDEFGLVKLSLVWYGVVECVHIRMRDPPVVEDEKLRCSVSNQHSCLAK